VITVHTVRHLHQKIHDGNNHTLVRKQPFTLWDNYGGDSKRSF